MYASEAKLRRELELVNSKLGRLPSAAHLNLHALKTVFGTPR